MTNNSFQKEPEWGLQQTDINITEVLMRMIKFIVVQIKEMEI